MKSPESILFDDSQWPLLYVTHPGDPVDKERTIEYLDKLEAYFRRKEKFVAVFDVSVSKPPTAEHRLMVATWIKANQNIIQPHFLGTAYIMPNLIQRLVLNTFLKFMDTSEIIGPVKVFDSSGKALDWAKSRIEFSLNKEMA